MKQVRYIFPVSHHYRLPFHERLREKLSARDVEYKVVYSEPPLENRLKRDTVEIPWGVKVPVLNLGGSVYQAGLREALGSDLVIVQQENKLLLNYLCNLASMLGARKVAYFGHGRNFQARNRSSRAERWKAFWAKRVDWWFGYTDETRRHIESLGFPPHRITVFNNAVDTVEMRALIAAVTPERLTERRAELGLAGSNTCVFVGGLYSDKRLEYLAAAADTMRTLVPDFELVIVGGGEQLQLAESLAETRPWLKVTGPRFGADKIELMMTGKLFLMPGLVGLALLDAAAAGLPIVTTAFPYHSPEIAYLEHGRNGLIVPEWENPIAYAEAVAALLVDEPLRQEMAENAHATAEAYTVEAMADLFVEGIMAALSK